MEDLILAEELNKLFGAMKKSKNEELKTFAKEVFDFKVVESYKSRGAELFVGDELNKNGCTFVKNLKFKNSQGKVTIQYTCREKTNQAKPIVLKEMVLHDENGFLRIREYGEDRCYPFTYKKDKITCSKLLEKIKAK